LPSGVLDVFQRLAERAVARRGVAELLLAELIELLNGLDAAVEISDELFVERLGRRLERLVELLGGQLLLGDRRFPRRLLLFISFGVGFGAAGARLLVLEH